VRDIEAKEREVALGINSRQNIAREAGRPDFSVIVRENEEDSAILESAGLPTNAGKAQAPPVPVRVEE
jgi:hypothetical protein